MLRLVKSPHQYGDISFLWKAKEIPVNYLVSIVTIQFQLIDPLQHIRLYPRLTPEPDCLWQR